MINRAELANARIRVRYVANGQTINGTYKLPPIKALEKFKADLNLILNFVQETINGSS